MSFLERLHEFGIHWETVITAVLIIIGAFILAKVLRWLIHRSFVTAAERINVDETRYKFFRNAVSLIVWVVAIAGIIFMIPSLKAVAITLFAGAGIFMAIVGFAAQEAFANIISGIFIVIFQPFRVGDLIKVSDINYGTVEDITLRHTILKSFENKRIIIPNSVISSQVITNDNITDEKICKWIEVGISYDSSVEKATKIIQEVAMAHPSCIDNRTDEEKAQNMHPVEVRLVSFGDFSINLRAFVWSKDAVSVFRMHSDLNKEIKRRFDAEGVEIPFPYRTLVYKKDLPENAK